MYSIRARPCWRRISLRGVLSRFCRISVICMFGKPLSSKDSVIMTIKELAYAVQQHRFSMCRGNRVPLRQSCTARDVPIRIHSLWSQGLWKTFLVLLCIILRHCHMQSLAEPLLRGTCLRIPAQNSTEHHFVQVMRSAGEPFASNFLIVFGLQGFQEAPDLIESKSTLLG